MVHRYANFNAIYPAETLKSHGSWATRVFTPVGERERRNYGGEEILA
ncbi:unnamed protein product [Nezara viridula]|uniref:Uncharacterized protein n=1 Tax=Nezara viridula TaxID=85310 RepID=A0A9P0GZE7_NEZVI|nr:unnamed protein product [Nezara viridula]